MNNDVKSPERMAESGYNSVRSKSKSIINQIPEREEDPSFNQTIGTQMVKNPF